jgi:hypothetical protein
MLSERIRDGRCARSPPIFVGPLPLRSKERGRDSPQGLDDCKLGNHILDPVVLQPFQAIAEVLKVLHGQQGVGKAQHLAVPVPRRR